MEAGQGGQASSVTSWLPRSTPRPWTLSALMLAAAAIVFAHRIDAFANPQFYAEDGSRWFSDAYNLGLLRALVTPASGSLQVLSRLGPVIGAPFGVANQPLVYNLCGLLIQLAPVFYFLSSRFESVVPMFWLRAALSLVYLLMPADELNVTITTAPVHLAILATLVIVAPAPTRWYWKLFDVSTALLCGLSGPFVFILFPIAALCYLVRRKRFTLVLLAVFALTLAAQLYASWVSPRPTTSVGASLGNLVLILSDRIILAGIFAEPGHRHVYLAGQPYGTLIASVICVLALPVVVFAVKNAPWELRLFGLASLGIVGAALVSPLVSFSSRSEWFILASSESGGRYFFMARVAWVVTLTWAASRLRRVWMRRIAFAAGGVAFASGCTTWAYTPFVNYDWPREAHTIQTAAPGTRLTLPINPGGPWAVEITVK
jgi:hypothetical protein